MLSVDTFVWFYSSVLKYLSVEQNMNQNCEEANENCSNFTFSIGSECNNSNTV
jgi:hypothetical protein